MRTVQSTPVMFMERPPPSDCNVPPRMQRSPMRLCYTSFFLNLSSKWSQARTVMAIIVNVGF